MLFYFPFFQINVVELYYFVKFGARLLNTGKKKTLQDFSLPSTVSRRILTKKRKKNQKDA